MTSRSESRPLATFGLLVSVLSVLLLGLVGTRTAAAATYPLPTRGQGQVSSSTVHAGQCVVFSGGGFQPGATVTVSDNGKVVGTTRADAKGSFRRKVCFGTDAALGQHTLSASGTGANGAGRVVTAVVTVVGVESSGSSTGGANGSGGGGAGAGRGAAGGGSTLPFTGSDIRTLVLIGLALLASGCLLVRKGYQDRAARRRVRSAAA